MKMLWLSFLLIGSITCGPVRKDYGSNAADTTFMQPFSSGYWYSGTGMSSGPGSGSSSPLPSLTNPSFDKASELPAPQDAVYYGPGSYGGTNMAEVYSSGYTSYNSPEVGQYGGASYDVAAPAGSYSGGYGSSAGVYGGDGSYGFAPATQDGDSSSGSASGYGAGNGILEPVFSDVSDLEPVYSFSSRSNYQRGRAIFAQTRYIPGEPVPPPMPVSRSKTVFKQSSPAKAPKGGYQ